MLSKIPAPLLIARPSLFQYEVNAKKLCKKYLEKIRGGNLGQESRFILAFLIFLSENHFNETTDILRETQLSQYY